MYPLYVYLNWFLHIWPYAVILSCVIMFLDVVFKIRIPMKYYAILGILTVPYFIDFFLTIFNIL